MKDGSNWAEQKYGGRNGKDTSAIGPLCLTCGGMAECTEITADDIVAERKQRDKRKSLVDDAADYKHHYLAKQDRAKIPEKKLKVCTEISSTLRVEFEVVPRQEVKDGTQVFPEQCEMMQVEGETGFGETIKGVVVTAKPRYKLVVDTKKVIMLGETVLSKDKLMYKNHAQRLFYRRMAANAHRLGLRSGDKYEKQKGTKIYNQTEFANLIAQGRSKLGLPPMPDIGNLFDSAGDPTSTSQSSGARRPSTGASPSPATPSAAAARAGLSLPRPSTALMIEDVDDENAAHSSNDIVGNTEMALLSASTAAAAAAATPFSMSVEYASLYPRPINADLSAWDKCRVKPPAYWLAKHVPENVFLLDTVGFATLQKELNFARACVARNTGNELKVEAPNGKFH